MSDDDLAPRPRPGFRTPRAPDAHLDRARLFAGALRALLGTAGFFASLQYLPIQMATPILSGVSLLMIVTGCTSAWRAVAGAPALRRLPLVLVAVCALAVATTLVLTVVLGAGALGPLARWQREHAQDTAPTIRFEAP